MNLNKPAKIILGILTFLPTLFVILMLGLFLFNILSMFFLPSAELSMRVISYFGTLLPYIFLILFLAVGLLIFYLVHIIQCKELDQEKRMLWIAVLFLAYGISTPIYWYLHVWKNDSLENLKHHESGTEL